MRAKKRGRPQVDTEEIRTRVPRATLDGINAFIAAQPDPKPSRPEALRIILRDWLIGGGYLPSESE